MRVLPLLSVSLLRRFWRSNSGVNAIEFAFVVPFVVAILLATIQISVVFIAQAYLATISESAMRVVLTNQAGGMTRNDFKNAVCAKVSTLFDCNSLIIDLEPAPTSAAAMAAAMPQFDASGNLKNATSYTLAGAPAKMLLVVMYQWPVVGGPLGFNLGNMGNGTLLLVSTQVFQIEPTS